MKWTRGTWGKLLMVTLDVLMVFTMGPWASVQSAYASEISTIMGGDSTQGAVVSTQSDEAATTSDDQAAAPEATTEQSAEPANEQAAASATSDDQPVTVDSSPAKVADAPDSVSAASDEGISAQADGEDYVKGSGNVSYVSLAPQGSSQGTEDTTLVEGGNDQVLTSTVGLAQNTNRTETASKVWIAFEITIPKKSTSGGEWGITSGSIYDMATGTTTVAQTSDGDNWVIRGRSLAQGAGQTVVPGTYTSDIKITNSNMVAGEQATVTEKAWLYDEDESAAQTATHTIKITTTPKYNLTFQRASSSILTSGWFNSTTNEFTTNQPADTSSWTYGRVVACNSYVLNEGNERLDPTKDIKWTLSYKVQTVTGGTATDEETPSLQPILLGVRSSDPAFSDSQLSGTAVTDMSLGGLADQSNSNEAWNKTHYTNIYGDDSPSGYTFTQSGSTISVTAHLSDSNKALWDGAGAYLEFFVPTGTEDGTTTSRRLSVTADGMSATSYSAGSELTDSHTDDNVCNVTIAPKFDGSTLGLTRYISTAYRDTVTPGLSIYNNIRGSVSAASSTAVSDCKIHDMNVLIKWEQGVGINSVWEDSDQSSYVNSSGGKIHPTVLYAVKANGQAWENETEMGHTTYKSLRYYDTYQAASSAGVVVGALLEYRGGIFKTDRLSAWCANHTVAGTAGNTYAIVQDVSTWLGDSSLTTDDTYAHTNGSAVNELSTTANSNMYSYDDPDNTDHQHYLKSTWDSATGTLKENEGGTWGRTIYVTGGEMVKNENECVQLNGSDIRESSGFHSKAWPTATYDIGAGQRTVDRSYGFSVTGSAPSEIHCYLDGLNSGKLNSTTYYLSTTDNPVTYTPNAISTLGGTFSGGTVIDPSDFVIPGAGNYKIFFTSQIGDASDLSNDAKSGTTYEDGLNVHPSAASKAYVSDNVDEQVYRTYVTKTSVAGLTKKASTLTTIDEPAWDNIIDTSTADMPNVYLLDVLPYDGDANGTVLHGTYTLKDDKVSLSTSASTGSATSTFAAYYTTSTAVRSNYDAATFVPADNIPSHLGDSFTISGVSWYKMTDNGDGTWSVPTDTAPTAVMCASDSLAAGERANFHVGLKLNGNWKGDSIVNRSSYCYAPLDKATTSTPSTVTVASRAISGTAWKDANKDGSFDTADGDTVLAGVTVKLFKADGTQITSDANGTEYGTVTTKADGTYTFANVPENPNGYYVSFSGSLLDTYKDTTKSTATPGTSTTDSDINAIDKGEYKTDVFTTLSDAEIVATDAPTYTYAGVSAGFQQKTKISYDGNGATTGSKPVADAYVSDGDTITVADNTGATSDPAVPYAKDGYTFAGWNTVADGSGTPYAAGDTFQIAGDTTLYAQWTKDVSATITGTKSVEGDTTTAKDFTFSIAAGDDATASAVTNGTIAMPSSTTATASGVTSADAKDFSFSGITFKATGIYKFNVIENDLPASGYTGYTKDGRTVTATVVVTKNTANELVAAIGYAGGSDSAQTAKATFKNTYGVAPVTVNSADHAGITKNVTGDTPAVMPTFTYTCVADQANPDGVTGLKTSATTTGAGTTDFGKATFTKAGVYKYTISETDDAPNADWTYSDASYTWTVKVEDQNGTLVVVQDTLVDANGDAANGAAFTNDYSIAILGITKSADVSHAKPGETITYTVDIANTGHRAATNVVTVDTLPAELTDVANISDNGVYDADAHTITWTDATAAGLGSVSHTFTATFKDDATPDSTVTNTAAITGGPSTTTDVTVDAFEPISVDPPVAKTITGDTPDTASTFNFTMTAADATDPMPADSSNGSKTVTRTGAGAVEFGEISYDKVGTYTYTISEANDGIDGYAYDTTVYTMTVEVINNAGTLEKTVTYKDANGVAAADDTMTFTNVYTTPGSPDVQVTKSVDSDTAVPGDYLTYTIHVANNGTRASEGIFVKDVIPDNTTFDSCDSLGVYSTTSAGEDYVKWWIEGGLQPGESVDLTLKVKVNECQSGTEIQNVALYQVTPNKPDGPTAEGTGTQTNMAKTTIGTGGASSGKLAKTGDTTDQLPIAILGAGALALIAFGLRRRREDGGC